MTLRNILEHLATVALIVIAVLLLMVLASQWEEVKAQQPTQNTTSNE